MQRLEAAEVLADAFQMQVVVTDATVGSPDPRVRTRRRRAGRTAYFFASLFES